MENLASLIRLVLLTVDGQTYALPLAAVDRMVRMVEVILTRQVSPLLVRHRQQSVERITTDLALQFLAHGAQDCKQPCISGASPASDRQPK